MCNTISILIPTHNRVDQLSRTLDSVSEQIVPDATDVELVIVANGCSDNTIAHVNTTARTFPFPLRCVDEPKLGLNAARNRGVREAKHEIVLFLDDDVAMSSGYLQSLVQVYEEENADIVGGKTELWWEVVGQPDWLPDELLNFLSCKDHGDKVCRMRKGTDLIGANFSFRKRVFEDIGPFKLGLDRTGDLLLGGGETEFLNRAFDSGYQAFYAPGCHVKHWVAPSRPTMNYLTGVAFGTAMSYIFARSSVSSWQAAKWSVYHCFHAAKHAVLEVVARVRRNRQHTAIHRVRRSTHCGYLNGIVLRLRGRSPVIHA